MFIGGPLDVLHQILALYTLRDPQLFCALSAGRIDIDLRSANFCSWVCPLALRLRSGAENRITSQRT